MENKLFLICPDSQSEAFIKEKYGQNVYFLTALAAVFNFQKISYVEAINDLLQEAAIREIFIVNDISCRFMKSILEKGKGYGTKAEQIMQELFIDNYSCIMKGHSLSEMKQKLAELNIQRQAVDIVSNELLLSQLVEAGISLKGLITTKTKGQLKELNLSLQEIYK